MRIERTELLEKLKEGMKSPLIKVIIGIRRCGKSYLLFEIFYDYLKSIGVEEDHIIRIKLDELSNAGLRNPIKLSEYIKSNIPRDDRKCYILIDEIQDAVKILNPALLDENGNLLAGVEKEEAYLTFHDVLNELINMKNIDCYVTGSNSKMLSSDLPTEFRNRNYNIEVTPLSFKELRQVYPNYQFDELWDEYMTYGGMPLAVLNSDSHARQQYLKDLFTGTYFKDIIDRYRLSEDSAIDTLTDMIASNIGSPLNPGKIERTFDSVEHSGITDNTIKKYIEYLKNSFLIEEARRYDVKGRKYIGTLSKYYFVDPGLRNARLNFRQIEESHLMENIIYNELVRYGYSVDVGKVEAWNYDPQTRKSVRANYEVDFVVNDGDRRYYIQSALNLNTNEKLNQESASLKKIDNSFKKIIIYKGYKKPYYTEDGIMILGLYNFLMDMDVIKK